jgi:hypothetical protein
MLNQSKSYGNIPKLKRANNVLTLCDKVKILDLLNSSLSLMESWAVLWEK